MKRVSSLMVLVTILFGVLNVFAQSNIKDYQTYYLTERANLLKAVNYIRQHQNLRLIDVQDRSILLESWFHYLNH